MTHRKLLAPIAAAWSAQTSSDTAGWTSENASWGQCAVTACLVQDLLGGEIVWAEAKLPDGRTISHYFNLVDGQEVDFTKTQFPPGTVIATGVPKTKGFATTRDYVLSFEVTRTRYDQLKARVLRNFTGMPRMECKKALVVAGGNFTAARQWLETGGQRQGKAPG